jgi:hypothetical protein
MTELRDGASSVSASMDPFADLNPGLASFTWRVVSLHMLTYILVGLVAFFALDYRSAFETTDLHYLMRPVNSPWVAAGPALQVFRGLLFAAVLYPLAPDILRRKNSVLLLWGLFVGFAILGTAGPSPGSLEGIIYTKLPISLQLMGLPEVVIQTLLFSAGLVLWCRKPARWKNVASGIGVAVVCLLGIAGFLAARSL